MLSYSKAFYGFWSVVLLCGVCATSTETHARSSNALPSDVGRGTIQRNDFKPSDNVTKDESSLTQNARTPDSFKAGQKDSRDPTDVARGGIQRNDFNPSKDASMPKQQALSAKIDIAKAKLYAAQALFKSEGISGAIHILNNKTADTTQRGRINESNISDLTESMDGISGVNCILNGRWKADGTGKKEGQSTDSWVDAEGQSVLKKVIDAFRKSGAGIVEVSYKQAGSDQENIIVAGDSEFFKHNNSGEKFFCFVQIS